MAKSKKPGETWKGHVSQEVKARYEAKKYQKILVRINREPTSDDDPTVDKIKAAAQAAGMSVNAWILEAIQDKL